MNAGSVPGGYGLYRNSQKGYFPFDAPELPPLEIQQQEENHSIFSRIKDLTRGAQDYFCIPNTQGSIRRKVLLGVTVASLAITTTAIGILVYVNTGRSNMISVPRDTILTPVPMQTPTETVPIPIVPNSTNTFLTSANNNCAAIQPDCINSGFCININPKLTWGWPDKFVKCDMTEFVSRLVSKYMYCDYRSSLKLCKCYSDVTDLSTTVNHCHNNFTVIFGSCCRIAQTVLNK